MGVWKPIDTASSGGDARSGRAARQGKFCLGCDRRSKTARRFGQYPSGREVGERFALVVRHVGDFSSPPGAPLLLRLGYTAGAEC